MSKKDPTKKEMITALLEIQDFHTEESLNKLNKTQVTAIAKEFRVYDKIGDPKPEDKVIETPKTEEAPAPFVSFCSFEFDPKTKSSCNVECSVDQPEEFKKCLENFKSKEIAPKKSSSAAEKTGTNEWGRLLGSQAELIEQCLLTKEPMTTKAIAEFAECTEARVRRHYLRIIHKEERLDENGENLGNVLKTAEGLIFLPWRFPEMVGTSAYPKKAMPSKKPSKTDKAE